jgi:hypothetical protein
LYGNGERIDGAVPEKQVWAVIDRALQAAGETPPPMPAEMPAPAPISVAPPLPVAPGTPGPASAAK